MTQKEFSKAVTADVNKKYDAEGKKHITEAVTSDVIKSCVDVASTTIAKGDKISFNGFGSFEVSVRAARDGRNPITGEKIHIAEKKTVKFKVAKAMKDALNN